MIHRPKKVIFKIGLSADHYETPLFYVKASLSSLLKHYQNLEAAAEEGSHKFRIGIVAKKPQEKNHLVDFPIANLCPVNWTVEFVF